MPSARLEEPVRRSRELRPEILELPGALLALTAVMVEEMVVRLEGLHQQQSLLAFDPQAVEVPEAVEAEAVEVPPQVVVAEAV